MAVTTIIQNLSRRLFDGLSAVSYGGGPATLYDAEGNVIAGPGQAPRPAPSILVAPTATPQAATVGQPVTLTLGQWRNSTALSGVLVQAGTDRSGEIVDGVWTPQQTGAFTWTVTATGPGGSTTAPVANGNVSEAAPVPVAPTITQQPGIAPTSPEVGDAITLSLGSASGTPAPTAVWTLTRNGADITDQVEGLTLTLTDPGTYVLTVAWTNSSGTATGTASVTVEAIPVPEAPTISIVYDPMQEADPLVTTDAAGTLYWVVTTSSTAPTAAQMLAGTAPARVADGTAETIPGPLTVDLGDLPALEDSLYLWVMVERSSDDTVSAVVGTLLMAGSTSEYATISAHTGNPTISDYTDADGSWRVYHWLTPGEASFTVSAPGLVEYLAVAGGGGGGGAAASSRHGGGGAGEFKEGSIFLAPGGVAFTVGAGGVGSTALPANATSGTDTLFREFTLLGGGHGGTRAGEVNRQFPANGGSGGGGFVSSGVRGLSQASDGVGHNGGITPNIPIGGCGGGAGSAAQDAVANPLFTGAAGTGVESSITGTAVMYAAGGSGSANNAGNAPAAATGGGVGGVGPGVAGTPGQTPGSGGGAGDEVGHGGSGAHGAVIIRVKV